MTKRPRQMRRVLFVTAALALGVGAPTSAAFAASAPPAAVAQSTNPADLTRAFEISTDTYSGIGYGKLKINNTPGASGFLIQVKLPAGATFDIDKDEPVNYSFTQERDVVTITPDSYPKEKMIFHFVLRGAGDKMPTSTIVADADAEAEHNAKKLKEEATSAFYTKAFYAQTMLLEQTQKMENLRYVLQAPYTQAPGLVNAINDLLKAADTRQSPERVIELAEKVRDGHLADVLSALKAKSAQGETLTPSEKAAYQFITHFYPEVIESLQTLAGAIPQG
ncbi:hypothetical protein [Streptomyces klenkii]|uniref:hypothetical protein n=1 Tax=Streptomyces klenkii TaxID=1420899 RepID=UPI003412B223